MTGAASFPPELSFAILGPLDVRRNGSSCAPTALKQRALLALLLCRVNEIMPTAALVDGLWGEAPPATARPALHGHVSAVRRLLVPGVDPGTADPRRHPVLRTELPGYVLRVPPDKLDLTNFRSLARTGRLLRDRGRCERAADVLAAAVALWRGPALADLRSVSVLAGHATRLDEEHLAALQDLIGVETCLGLAAQQVGVLEELCARHPLREPLYALLMTTLSGTGRRAEALAVYARARRVIIDEVGVEPGTDLRRAHQAILAGVQPRLHGHVGHRAAAVAWRPNPGLRRHLPAPGSRISQSPRRW